MNHHTDLPSSIFDLRKRSSRLRAFVNPRALLAFALFATGASLAAFASTPSLTEPSSSTSTSAPSFQTLSSPLNSTGGLNQLPAGVPLPAGARFSPNAQTNQLGSGVGARFPGLKGLPFRSQAASNNTTSSLGNPSPANQQPSAPTSATSSAGQGAWSIVNSPNGPGADGSELDGLTCTSASDCWAVGFHSSLATSVVDQTLIEHWDGSAWSIVNSPNININSTQENVLSGVTCVSASDCWAVGSYFNGIHTQILTEHWDGASWSIATSANVSVDEFNVLNSVSCVSASDCWAVGSYYNGTYQTLIEHWDGTSWAILDSPNTSAYDGDHLLSVTCASTSDCWAVGWSLANGSVGSPYTNITTTLVEHWNGTWWSIVTSPNVTVNGQTTSRVDSYLNAVTCVSASDCWAVGNTINGGLGQTITEHWDGSKWSIVTSPNATETANNYLGAVTCASAFDCWAVGYYFTTFQNAVQAQTLAEHWDGTQWFIVSSPNNTANANTDISPGDELNGVTCISASGCWAIGRYGYYGWTLTEHWDGTSWSIVTSPNSTEFAGSWLLGTTCVSASDCWAVGYYFTGSDPNTNRGGQQTLVEHWDGASWAIVASPNATTTDYGHGLPEPSGTNNDLEDVTCTSSSDCWAVGSYVMENPVPDQNDVRQTLIEHWDGTQWSIATSANFGIDGHNELFGVSCVSASDCWAVGDYQMLSSNGSRVQGLTEHWDGTSWTMAAAVNPPALQNWLTGINCTSTSDCWAVGYSVIPNGTNIVTQPLIEHWDGTVWSFASSASGPRNSVLFDVTCTSASACFGTGYYIDDAGLSQTLIERWDGASWAIVSSPQVSGFQAYLLRVTCASPSECWAVGWVEKPTIYNQTLVEHWDGASWTIVTSSNVDAEHNYTYGVACSSTTDCWAVGNSYSGNYGGLEGTSSTLTEHYGLSVQLSAVVSRKTHGSAGAFDVDLTSGNGIECRSGGANGGYELVFTFANPLTSIAGASVTNGTGSVATSYIDSADAHNYIVNLTGVANAQRIAVGLTNVTDSIGDFSPAVAGQMGVLLGDVNDSGRVDAADVSAVRQQTLRLITQSNFREDVNVSGRIDAADVSIVRQQTLTSLP